ncbi:MAG: hypothetical protein AB1458_05850 [Bacteroidota bacterium]
MRSFRAILIFSLSAVSLCSSAQKMGGDVHINPKDIVMKWRASFMAVVSFYKPNTDYMGNVKPTQGFGLSYKGELNFPESKKLKLLMGIEYLGEGITFDSYYFPVGSTPFYDKNFAYTHKVRLHELYIPILFKQSINSENDNTNSFYFSAGWAYRYMLGAGYRIISKTDSKMAAKGVSPLTIEHDLLMENGSSALMAGIGAEHRIPNMKQGWVFEVYYRYNLSRHRYIGDNNSNNILFRNNNLSISVGYEF